KSMLDGRLKRGVQIFLVVRVVLVTFTTVWVLAMNGCEGRQPPSPVGPGSASSVGVTAIPGGRVVIKTSSAEFEILPSGYIQAYLLENGTRLSLDEPESAAQSGSDSLLSAGREIGDFAFVSDQAKVSEAHNNLGLRGKTVEVKARTPRDGPILIEKTI